MGPICRVISGSNFFMKFWPSLLINLHHENVSIHQTSLVAVARSPEHSFGEDCVAGLQILPGTTFPASGEETLELRVDVLQLHVEIGGGDLNLAALSHPQPHDQGEVNLLTRQSAIAICKCNND